MKNYKVNNGFSYLSSETPSLSWGRSHFLPVLSCFSSYGGFSRNTMPPALAGGDHF
jgi:hypothetical protein